MTCPCTNALAPTTQARPSAPAAAHMAQWFDCVCSHASAHAGVATNTSIRPACSPEKQSRDGCGQAAPHAAHCAAACTPKTAACCDSASNSPPHPASCKSSSACWDNANTSRGSLLILHSSHVLAHITGCGRRTPTLARSASRQAPASRPGAHLATCTLQC